jgi:hypothetical protein
LKRCLLVLALAGCGTPHDRSDWEREHASQLAPAPGAAVKPPAYPREGDLIEFYVAATSGFRFFVDPASLSVTEGGEVRYTLVARSSAGARNITYEGMRCNSGEVRLYAVGHDGTWGGRAGDWRPIQPKSVQRWHNALFREYFCPQREPILNAQEGIAALRSGGHSAARGFSDDQPRGGTGR